MPDSFNPLYLILLAALGLPIAIILWNELGGGGGAKISLPIVGDVEVPEHIIAQVRDASAKGESLIDLVAQGEWARHWAASICATDVPEEQRQKCIDRIARYIASKLVNQFA